MPKSSAVSGRRRGDRHRSIFVTVGTTKFDSLVAAVSTSQFLSLVSQPDYGAYERITVQYGRGEVLPFASDDRAKRSSADQHITEIVSGVSCSAYRFKPTLREEMEKADLIISHAGAGSIMEGLELCYTANEDRSTKDGDMSLKQSKKLVVVTNAALMNAHQSELADALEARGHLFVVNDPMELLKEKTLRRIEQFEQIPFEGGDGGADFAALIDNHFGFEE